MSLSRSNRNHQTSRQPDAPYKDIPQDKRFYVGRDKAEIQYSVEEPLHWSERLAMGYKPQAWPKLETDRDDDRFNLKENENYEE